MDGTSGNRPGTYLTAGLLAHVDAGKTTLSEALLYRNGVIREMGRVDNGDAFLDNFPLERARGITVFSKQAMLREGQDTITLLDTPGHVDFSAEMERTLQVLDYAILVISGAEGVQGHTRTLWHLLERYRVPVFLFVNKMDQPGTDKEELLGQLRAGLHENCLDFSKAGTEAFYEEAAMCGEDVLEHFLEHGSIGEGQIRELVASRRAFPCYFGSALKFEGVEEFWEGFRRYTRQPKYPAGFGAKVFKVSRDSQGNRLTYLKVTGGSLKVREAISPSQEKVSQIRLYSGEKYETAKEVLAGAVCAVIGLTDTRPGMGLGVEADAALPFLVPVLTYQVIPPPGCSHRVMLSHLYQLQEEDPELHITWDGHLEEIQVQIMGEVQLEVLKSVIAERFGLEAAFGAGNILYKETIASTVEGVGHYEPLRHYAEVHLLLEPGEPGSGLVFDSICSVDILARNWQRLVLTHLEEKEHRGVLTGSAITDMKITLVTGRAHLKHTEGGDFRQATYRAVRQGLMEAESVLLEPVYQFRLEVPDTMIGRAMADIERMHGAFEPPLVQDGMAVFTGSAPVAAMGDYQKEVAAYSKGRGRLSCALKGYEPCQNPQDIIERMAYDPERDLDNPTGSVFCSHGAGFVVSWDQVKEYMHVEGGNSLAGLGEAAGGGEGHGAWGIGGEGEGDGGEIGLSGDANRRVGISAGKRIQQEKERRQEEAWLGEDEVEAILSRTSNANRREREGGWRRYHKKKETPSPKAAAVTHTYRQAEPKEEYLLVDGYNVIFAWEGLRKLAEGNIDSARGRLLDILCDYQGIRKCNLIVVFDAYRVERHKTEILDYQNIHVVFTQEAETADQYIEKFAHENARKYQVTVVTSDGLEQIIIRGQGCALVSAREFQGIVKNTREENYREYTQGQEKGKHYLGEVIKEKMKGEEVG